MNRPPRPIDWPAVLADIAWQLGDALPGQDRVPLGTERLARALGVSRGSVRYILDGTEPRHSDGEEFIARWSSLTGKHASFAPRIGPAGIGRLDGASLARTEPRELHDER